MLVWHLCVLLLQKAKTPGVCLVTWFVPVGVVWGKKEAESE